jgi:hypothetical protein
MKNRTAAIALTSVCVLVALCAPQAAGAAKDADFLGDWHGSSTCLVRPSACHDEEALYHVKAGEKPGTFSMQADKIVNGTPEVMGPPAECNNQGKKDVLHCEFGRGFLDLTLQGDHLDGAMFLTDKTRWREIKLTRVKQQSTP